MVLPPVELLSGILISGIFLQSCSDGAAACKIPCFIQTSHHTCLSTFLLVLSGTEALQVEVGGWCMRALPIFTLLVSIFLRSRGLKVCMLAVQACESPAPAQESMWCCTGSDLLTAADRAGMSYAAHTLPASCHTQPQ